MWFISRNNSHPCSQKYWGAWYHTMSIAKCQGIKQKDRDAIALLGFSCRWHPPWDPISQLSWRKWYTKWPMGHVCIYQWVLRMGWFKTESGLFGYWLNVSNVCGKVIFMNPLVFCWLSDMLVCMSALEKPPAIHTQINLLSSGLEWFFAQLEM